MDLQKNVGDSNDIEKNKIAAVLSYIGILFIVPLILAPDSKFARYHANQGLCLFIAEVIYGIISVILGWILGFIPIIGALIMLIIGLIRVVFLILSILGIVNAAKGEMKPLPVIGDFDLIK